MINPLSSTAASAAVAKASGVGKTGAVSAAKATRAESVDAPKPAADMAALGPPVDTDKVDRIRQAIASGSYTLDVQAIAARMVDFDLPPS